MIKKHLLFFLLAAISCYGAVSYTIDGNIADWSIDVKSLISSTAKSQNIEDQNTSYLNPGYGGQLYDAEALYIDYTATNVFIAVLTGMPKSNPQNPSINSYGPGDLVFNFNGGTPEFAVKILTDGSYSANNFYAGSSWNNGIYPYIVSVKTGTLVSSADVAYSISPVVGLGNLSTSSTDNHYFIEARIPVSSFGSYWSSNGPTTSVEVSWGALCANDMIYAQIVPEHSTYLSVMTLSCAAIFFAKKRKKL